MATSLQHVQQWKHNRDLLACLNAAYPDWLVTISFYTALHAVDALLAHDKVQRVHSHDARARVLMDTNRYQKIWSKYQPMYDLCRTIRYLADPAAWVPVSRIEADVFKRYLYPIEQSVGKLMGTPLYASPIILKSTP